MSDFSLIHFAQSLFLAAIVALGAWRLGLLSINGLIGASLLGGIVYGLGGLEWALLLISFFLSSSLLSKSFSGRKKKVAKVFAKGGQRDWAQVAANGGVGAIVILMAFADILTAAQAWLAFAASLAAVNVLPEEFASDQERVARFEREAKLLASLNHPNIASIYRFEENALVLELVEGRRLRSISPKAPSPSKNPSNSPFRSPKPSKPHTKKASSIGI